MPCSTGRSRFTKPLGTLAATLALARAGLPESSQASAVGPACRYVPDSTLACFTMGSSAGIGWKINFHMDVYVPTYYAEGLAACGRANPLSFKAQLWGDDGGGSADDYLGIQAVPLPGYPVAGENYLMAFFTFDQANSQLDEDRGTDRDELYASTPTSTATPA